MRPTRRAFVASLLATAACPRAPLDAVRSVPDGPYVLGWRLAPGMQLAYRAVVTRAAGGVVSRRAEEWTYLVRALDDDGTATLDGELTGFGVGIEVDGAAVPDTDLADARGREEDAAVPVELRVTLDGRLLSSTARSLQEALPHRVLALDLPTRAVDAHDQWPEAGTVGAFADLLPLDLEVSVEGTARLLEVYARAGRLLAAIETTGTARSPEGPRIEVRGVAEFDLEAGRLARRTIEARFAPPARDPAADPGVLTVEVFAP